MIYRRGHTIFKIVLTLFIVAGIACFTANAFLKNPDKPNIVRYAYPPSGISIQFELPKGYGAVKDTEGEGLFQVNYIIGAFAPESGTHVLQSSLSVADNVRIIPSYDPKIITLEDWRAARNAYDKKDASSVRSLEIAGVKADVLTFSGMGETTIVQFVKDKNYYEIHTSGRLTDEPIAKIIDTFTFIK